MLHEYTLRLLRDHPWDILRIPFWLSRGKASCKRRLTDRIDFDPSLLPYNQDLLDWLKEQRSQGRMLVLCTASDLSIAKAISAYLGIFDEVMASNGATNLAGKHKAEALEQRFGHAGYDYAGNSGTDLAVWQKARRAVVVNASTALARKAEEYCRVERVFPSSSLGFSNWSQVLRMHQWLKNLLLFAPMLAAHQVTNLETWRLLILAFFSFSLCASSVYITNDLLDLESDRQHPRKCKRPFASGMVPPWQGVVLSPLLLLGSLILALHVGTIFLGWLMFYFVLSCAYSWGIKRLMLLDCLTLTMLYTVRIISGAAAAGMALSFWLLAFAVFLFLSLAFVKRYAELQMQLLHGQEKAHGRGYYTQDAPLVQMMGITSGYSAVVVLALYLNSNAVVQLYRAPKIVWGAVPVILFWISWMWMQAHRGEMHDDPLLFALKDKASLLAGVLFAAVLAIGALGWPW